MTDERCGSRLNKRPWLTCRSRPVTGYGRCSMHLGLGGGALWRHGDEASQRASLAHLQARRALWNDKRRADGLPYYAGANPAMAIGRPPRWLTACGSGLIQLGGNERRLSPVLYPSRWRFRMNGLRRLPLGAAQQNGDQLSAALPGSG